MGMLTKMTKENIYKIIEAGIAAPSGDNVQPWRFRWDGENRIDVNLPDLDIDKSLFNTLYQGQKIASLMSAGAAIENMRLCADELGYRAEVAYFPDADRTENCIGRLALNQDEDREDLSLLSSCIFKRHVNRKLYDGRKIDSGLRDKILKESEDYNFLRRYWLEDRNVIRKVVDLIRLSEQMMFENQQLMVPIMAAIRWNQEEILRRRDGMPIASLELGPFKRTGFRVYNYWQMAEVLNYLGLSRFSSLHSAKLANSASALCLLTTARSDNLESYLKGGQLLERIWLICSSLGMAVQPMAGVALFIARFKLVEGQGLSLKHRDKIRYMQDMLYPYFGLPGEEVPLMLLRIGYAAPSSARSSRFRVEELSNLKEIADTF